MKITKCAECEREMDLDVDAQTYCPGCKKHFCFSLCSPCFSNYHNENGLDEGHSSQSISDPSWEVNLKCR